LSKPRAARRGAGSAAQKDGHPRQNSAYRPATEKTLEAGLFLLIAKQEIIQLLRRAGHFEAADEADRSLPDPVELERAAEFGARFGITRDELISRMRGSP
jgi:hypothetical protein